MDDNKKLSEKTTFLIYGAGEVGNQCYQRLQKQGYRVIAALDQNKSGDHIIGNIPTYRLGTEPKEWDKSSYIVIICLANGMIHKKVADQLYHYGYCYLVFLPIGYCMPDAQKCKLTKDYNALLFADKSIRECTVFHYEKYVNSDFSVETGILCKGSHDVTVWMGLEMLFSESLELWKGDRTKIYTKSKYKNRNIACANPCEDLFRYYSLKSKSYDAYFDSFKQVKSQEKQQQELKQREELYHLFQREHQRGMTFFIEGAPPVVWNPNHYCNLVGGHHRTLYLLNEGHSLFPVKMEYSDFDIWCNHEVYQKLQKYIRAQNIQQFYSPLPHPAFLNFPSKCEDCGHTKLATVLRFFADEDLSNQTILDCMEDEGYFARNFDRIGAKKSTFLSKNRQQVELADLFNQLLYRNVSLKFGNLKEQQESYDIIFAAPNQDTDEIWITYLKLLGKCCKKYLIMETINQEEVRSVQIYANMKPPTFIHREYRDGVVWELGIYQKQERD